MQYNGTKQFYNRYNSSTGIAFDKPTPETELTPLELIAIFAMIPLSLCICGMLIDICKKRDEGAIFYNPFCSQNQTPIDNNTPSESS